MSILSLAVLNVAVPGIAGVLFGTDTAAIRETPTRITSTRGSVRRRLSLATRDSYMAMHNANLAHVRPQARPTLKELDAAPQDFSPAQVHRLCAQE